MKSRATTDVALVNGRARAELRGLDLVVEDVAEVDVGGRDNSVRNHALRAGAELVVAVEGAGVVVFGRDGVEAGGGGTSAWRALHNKE